MMADNPEKTVSESEAVLIRDAAESWDRFWSDIYASNGMFHSFSSVHHRLFKRSGGAELAWSVVAQEIPPGSADLILDAGCGTGYLSLRLMQAGSSVILTDVSPAALKLARRYAESVGLQPVLIKASVLHLPFKPGVFGHCFNVGVLDNFGPESRAAAVREMHRMIGREGKVTIVTNSARSLVHHRAMRHAQKKGTWPHGFKDALHSLNDIVAALPGNPGCREYTRGFISQFEFMRYFLPGGELLKKLFFRLFYLLSLPLAFLNRLPGQYLVTIIEKRK